MSDFDWRIDEDASWPPKGRPKPPYGPTALEVLRSCPLRRCFEVSRGYERRMSFDGRVGTAFHRILEWLSQRRPGEDSPDESAVEVRERFAEELRAQRDEAASRPRERGLPQNEERIHAATEALLTVSHQIQGTASRRRQSLLDRERPAENEPAAEDATRAEVEVPVKSRDGLFTGKVDRVEHTPEGTHLLDYKSALRDDLPGRYERQVQLYASMWRDTRGEYPIAATVIYPLVGKSHPVSVAPDVCKEVVREYTELVSSIRGRPAYDLATPGDTCKICEFRPWCKPFWHWQAREKSATVALERAYLGFEGVIPEGNYGAGTVMVWDLGTYESPQGDPDEGFRQGKLTVLVSASDATFDPSPCA
ncbi:MAG: PD-(D/E)XK nuclease family protein, partial [Alicyclobacillus sp.]|nr:PD-(D/E)XK nuclease family protein [Alicyclobacillus sp.]